MAKEERLKVTPTPIATVIVKEKYIEKFKTVEPLYYGIPLLIASFISLFWVLRKKRKVCLHENSNLTTTTLVGNHLPVVNITKSCPDCGVTIFSGYGIDWAGVKNHKDYGYSEGCGCMVTFFAASNFETSHFTPDSTCKIHSARFSTKERNAFLERARKSREPGLPL